MSGLIEDSWIATPASVFNLLWNTVLIKICEKSPSSPRHVPENRSIYIGLSDHHRYSSIWHQNLAKWSFLKGYFATWNLNPINKLLFTVKLILYQSCTLNIYFTHAWLAWYHALGILANTGSLSYRIFINTFQYKMSNNHIC